MSRKLELILAERQALEHLIKYGGKPSGLDRWKFFVEPETVVRLNEFWKPPEHDRRWNTEFTDPCSSGRAVGRDRSGRTFSVAVRCLEFGRAL